MEMLDGIRGGIGLLGSISIGLPVLGIVAMATVAFLMWKRTRSVHPLMARMWRLFHGNKECKDPAVGDFLDEQAALMEFRFTTGVQVRTRKQAHAIIDWTRKHNEDIGDVAACGSYFDLERPALKDESELPGRWLLLGRLALAFVMFLPVILFAFGIFWDSAALQMKKSGTFFTLSTEYVKPLWSESGVSKAQCLSGQALPANVFSEEDARIVCDIFKDKNLTPYLQKTVKQQRIAFTFGMLVFTWYCWVVFGWFMYGANARVMLKRLSKQDCQVPLALVVPERTEAV